MSSSMFKHKNCSSGHHELAMEPASPEYILHCGCPTTPGTHSFKSLSKFNLWTVLFFHDQADV